MVIIYYKKRINNQQMLLISGLQELFVVNLEYKSSQVGTRIEALSFNCKDAEKQISRNSLRKNLE